MYIHLATIVTNKVCEVKLVTTDKEEDAMEYQKNREKRIRIFEDTLYYCERTACLSEAIMRTRKNTVLYRHPLKELNNMDKKRYKQSCEVFVSRNRILKTAGKLCLEFCVSSQSWGRSNTGRSYAGRMSLQVLHVISMSEYGRTAAGIF